MYAACAAFAGVEQHLFDRVLVALVIVLHFHQQLEARIGALAFGHARVYLLGKLPALFAGGAHLLDGIGHLSLKMRLAFALLAQKFLRRGELLVQRAHARVRALLVLAHAGKLVFQRCAQRFQTRLLIAHIAQAVHGLDDLLFFRLGLCFKRGKLGLKPRQFFLACGLLLLKRLQLSGFFLNLFAQFFHMALDAAAAVARRVPLGNQAVALAFAGKDALAHDLHRAFAGLDFANPFLYDFALCRRLVFQRFQAAKPFLARRGDGLEFFFRLPYRFGKRLERRAQLGKARLIALRANQVHVYIQYLQFVAQRQVFAGRLTLLLERFHARFQLG